MGAGSADFHAGHALPESKRRADAAARKIEDLQDQPGARLQAPGCTPQRPGCTGAALKGRRRRSEPRRMWLDAILLLVLGAYAAVGAWRGPAESALRLGAWVLGYGAAWLAATSLGAPLAEALGLAPLLGLPLAGCGAFLAVQVCAHVAIARVRSAGAAPALGGRVLGAALGAARGAVVVVLLGWLALVGDGLRAQGVAGLPAAGGSALGRASGALVERSALAALGGERPEARAVAALVARPAETVAAWRDLLAHPSLAALQADAGFWRDVEAGDLAGARTRSSFRALTADAALRRELGRLGLVTAAGAAHPVAFERELAAALGEAAERVSALRDDPEVQALLADPEIRARLERGDALGLLAHPGFQGLLRRVSAS